MELATGRRGSPHITSQQDRQKHQGIFGYGAYILNTGNRLEPEVQSSNKIHIKDGALMFQGALFTVKVGTYDEVTINDEIIFCAELLLLADVFKSYFPMGKRWAIKSTLNDYKHSSMWKMMEPYADAVRSFNYQNTVYTGASQ